MPKKKSHEEFVAQLSAVNPNIVILGTYVNSQSHILCQCSVCNKQWNGIPNNLLRKEGCPQCARNQRVTQEDFIKNIARIHPNIEIIGQYINYNTHVDCLCHICGNRFSSAPYSLMSGRGCRKCGRDRTAKRNTKSNEAFLERLKIINPGIIPLEPYQNARKKILCQCTCGNTWYITPGGLYKGSKCMKCRSARDKKATDPNVFSKTIAAVNPTIELLEPYYRSNKKIQVRCKICGHQWSTWPQQLLRGDNCPNCIRRLSTSFPEQALYYYLKIIYPDAINSFKDGFGKTELDIFLPSINTGIEYDGRKWHGNKKPLEISKYKICRQKGFQLIRIRERICADDEGTICDKVIQSKYGDTKRYKDLDQCIEQLFGLLNTDHSSIEINTEKDHSNIESNYYGMIRDHSLGAKYPQIAAEWYQRRNGSVTPFMITPKNNNSYYWKCKTCGHIYPSVVSNRTAGHGCTKCAGQYRRSAEDFRHEISRINPDIEIISDFQNTDSKITICCRKCGETSVLNARSLLQGGGCKKCNYAKLHADRVMTESIFLDRVAKIRPDIRITGNYICASKRIACECHKCGYTWNPIAGSILYQSTGCPRCSGRIKKPILCIETGIQYDSLQEAENKTGISHSILSRCCNGKGYTAGGYHWRFV